MCPGRNSSPVAADRHGGAQLVTCGRAGAFQFGGMVCLTAPVVVRPGPYIRRSDTYNVGVIVIVIPNRPCRDRIPVVADRHTLSAYVICGRVVAAGSTQPITYRPVGGNQLGILRGVRPATTRLDPHVDRATSTCYVVSLERAGRDHACVLADRHRSAQVIMVLRVVRGQLGGLRGGRPFVTRLDPHVDGTPVSAIPRRAGRDRGIVAAERHRVAQGVIGVRVVRGQQGGLGGGGVHPGVNGQRVLRAAGLHAQP